MTFNRQQVFKLKSLIKAKLSEFGESVDEPLTDYVVIMVANKKPEKHIAQELKPFLGGLHNSTSFSSWLFKTIPSFDGETNKTETDEKKQTSNKSQTERNKRKRDHSSSSSSQSRKKRTSTTKEDSREKSRKSRSHKRSSHRRRHRRNRSRSSSSSSSSSSSLATSPDITSDRKTLESSSPNYSNTTAKPISLTSKFVEIQSATTNEKIEKTETPLETEHKTNDALIIGPVPPPPSSLFHEAKCDSEMIRNDSNKSSIDRNIDNSFDTRNIEFTFETNNTTYFGQQPTLQTVSQQPVLDYNTSSQHRIRRDVRRRELIVVVESNGAAKKEKLTTYSRRPNHLIDKKPFPIRTDHFNACDKCHVTQSCCCSIEAEKKLMYIKEMSRLLAEAAAKVKKQNTRCVFWPNCEKADLCPFLHPSKPCLVFPNCPYGPACHYVHPPCRYDGFCARFDCPFTHYGMFSTSKVSSKQTEQPNTANESIEVLQDSNITDNRANIIESLPISCKHGNLCKNPSCMYSHNLPQKCQLKWTAPKQSEKSLSTSSSTL